MCNYPCKKYQEWRDVVTSEGLEESPPPCIFCMNNYFEDL